ncbi:MAG: hypothetical protein JO267_08775 [Alphaproteobacteria bacterium]|nr:hypothetical protein [Alphaproteobacteria bacterium]MBV9862226.1 hypothetical protein [Alphaproteobacteria bacterium]
MDAELRGRNRVRSYRELVRFALDQGLTPRLFRDYAANPIPANVVLLRHDVDHSLDNAAMLAEIDAALGVPSTFFMLPPGDYRRSENYYGHIEQGRVRHAPGFFERCRKIAAMGHEIGIHNDFVQLSYLTRRTVAELLRDEIAAFADAGIFVRGTAAHGSRFARDHDLVNYEIFAGAAAGRKPVGRSVEQDGWSAILHQIDAAGLGLTYEAYRVPRNIDFSDSGSTVRISSRKTRHAALDLLGEADYRPFGDVIAEALEPRLVMLIHPCWWTPV